MHRQPIQEINPPQQGSALKKLFELRMQNMSQTTVSERPQSSEHIPSIDNYIDSNYNNLDRYVDDEPEYGDPYVAPSGGHGEYDAHTMRSEPSLGWTYDNNDVYDNTDVLTHRRTTSIHRNIMGVHPRGPPSRNLEERRNWISCAATLNRQPLEEHANKIFQYMQQDNALKEDTSDAEELRRDALRDMPQSLAVKKLIKRKFVSSRSNDHVAVGCLKLLKYQISMWFSQIKGNVKDFTYTFELWYGILRKIEGNFGSGVSSYFKFLRWLFLINVFMTLFCICFISVPQIIHDSRMNTSEVEDNGTANQYRDSKNTAEFQFVDIFQGGGYFDNTLLYFGYYTNVSEAFSIPLSYFFTNVCVYIVVFLVLSYSMARSYRKSFIETRGGLQNVFAHKIFCGWDYSIATTKAASLKKRSIFNEIKELLGDIKHTKGTVKFSETCTTYIIQGTAHVFSISAALACGYLMYYLLDEENTLIPGIVISAVMVVVPTVYRLLASYEDYKSPKISLFVTLARTVFLELVVVGVLLYYWLREAKRLADNNKNSGSEDLTRSERVHSDCWENELGQEIYRLILFDFFFSTLFMAVVDIAWYFAHKLIKSVEAPEFDIATNTLSVIYNQTLFWVGFYFSPLLGVMVVVKLFLTWYIRSYILLQCCEAPKKAWRAAQTESWFLIITFLWSLVLLFVHGYHIVMIGSSTQCGPFRNDLKGHLDINSDSKILAVVFFILKPGVIALILIGMLMGVYYLRAIANAQADMVSFLRNRLVLASKDKEFLIKNINDVSQGKYKFNKPQERDGLTNPEKVAPRIIRSTDVEYDCDRGIPEAQPGSSNDDFAYRHSNNGNFAEVQPQTSDDLFMRHSNINMFDGNQRTPDARRRY